MLASHLIYFYLTMESSTQVLLADKTKTSNRVSTPHNNQDYFEFQMNLLAGSEQFTELKEPLVIGAPLMQHIPCCLDHTEAVQALRLQN